MSSTPSKTPEELLPSDPYLRAAVLQFERSQGQDAPLPAVHEHHTDPAEQDLLDQSHPTTSAHSNYNMSEAELANLSTRRIWHALAGIGMGAISARFSTRITARTTAMGRNDRKAHLEAFGVMMLTAGCFYHINRFTTLGKFSGIVEQRYKVQANHHKYDRRQQFLYEPAFRIPARKI
eukprot:Sspe_Gene.84701::Locus_55604_Transcript_1_4_Confidence_0.250_Length_670::g.84701::m.84701